MFGKLLFLVLVLGAAACVLLAARHERLTAAHRSAELHRRLLEQEHRLWALHGEVALRTRPEEVRALIERAGTDWAPILHTEERPAYFSAAEK